MFEFLFRKRVNITREKRNVSNLALGVASIMLLTTLSQIGVVLLLSFIAPAVLESAGGPLLINAVCMYGIAMPLSLVFFRQCDVEPIKKQQKLGFGTMMAAIVVCYFLSLVGSILGELTNELMSATIGTLASNPVEDAVSELSLFTILLYMVILAPIFEEIFFRRVVIDRLRRYGDLPAILISGLVFGAIHGNFSQFFYAAFIGVIYGAIYIYTGRLRYSIILHMVFNFIGGFYPSLIAELFNGRIPEYLTETVAAENPLGYALAILYNLFMYACLIALIPSAIHLYRKLKLSKKNRVKLNAEQCRAVVWNNGGFWVSVGFLVAFFALSLL